MALPTTSTAAFLHLILPYAEGCPEPVAELHARLAAIEFCERTRCWRHIVTIALAANGQALAAPDYSAIHEIETATLNGRDLTPTQMTEIAVPELTGAALDGQARYITQIDPNTVSVYPFEEGTLRASLFLKPKNGQQFGGDAANPLRDAFNVVPEFLAIQHGERIAAGALARVLEIKGERWSDPNMAQLYRARFDEACAGNFASNLKMQHRAPIRTKPSWM